MFEIVMDGPGKNALGSQMMDFLLAKLGEAAGKPVLLTGKGDAFSAGLNLKEVASLDAPGMEVFLVKLEKLMISSRRCQSVEFRARRETSRPITMPGVAQADFAHQCFEALAVRRRRCGLPQVAIDDGDLLQ